MRLFIPGTPVQQGSLIPRVIFVKGRPRAVLHSHNSEGLKRWRKAVSAAVAAEMDALGMEGPLGPYVAISAVFQMPKPKTTKYPDYPGGTPDLDKLQRAVGDALTASGIVQDDARIVRWHTDETWAGGLGSLSAEPGLWLEVTDR